MVDRVERRTNLAPRNNIDSLINSYNKELGHKRKDQLADELVKSATEDNFDCYSILKVIDLGLDAALFGKSEEKKRGWGILKKTADFFVSRRLTTKTFLPNENVSVRVKDEALSLERNVSRKMESWLSRNSVLKIQTNSIPQDVTQDPAERTISMLVLKKVTKIIEDTNSTVDYSSGHPNFIAAIAIAHSSIPDTELQKGLDLFKQIFDLANHTLTHYGVPFKVKNKASEQMISLLNSQKEGVREAIPSFLNYKCGETSIGELLEETSQDKFNKMVNAFMADIPKGDVAWATIAASLFWSTFDLAEDQMQYEGKIAPLSAFAKRIYDYQSYMVKNIFSPEDQKEGGSDFDRDFSNVLENIDSISMLRLVNMLLVNIYEAPLAEMFFNPDKTREEALMVSSLSRKAYKDILPTDSGLGMSLLTEVLFFYFSSHASEIKQNFTERFFGDKKAQNFINLFYSVIDNKIPTRVYTDMLIGQTKEGLGESLEKMEEAEVKDALIVDVMNLTKELEGLENLPFPEPHKEISYEIPLGTYPSNMGFGKLYFFPGEKIGDPIRFLVEPLERSLVGIYGIINVKERVINYPLGKFSEANTEVLELLTSYTAVGYLLDYLEKKGLINDSKGVCNRAFRLLGLRKILEPEQELEVVGETENSKIVSKEVKEEKHKTDIDEAIEVLWILLQEDTNDEFKTEIV